ncbi:MAG TPA: DUF2283 domain-containing protein [Longimicrobiaceae bacterium]|nr:DUF2283 domain-containing protein [Longimicrobiaceae bacterium]
MEFKHGDVTETRDLDENTVLDLDEEGSTCAITLEQASVRTDISSFAFEYIAE